MDKNQIASQLKHKAAQSSFRQQMEAILGSENAQASSTRASYLTPSWESRARFRAERWLRNQRDGIHPAPGHIQEKMQLLMTKSSSDSKKN